MNPELLALDPLFLTNVKLFIKDLVSIEKVDNVPTECFHLYNHVVRFVELVGIIVGVEQKSNQIFYTVDDSTGTINCCQWIEPLSNVKTLPLGTVVKILGKLTTFRDYRQVAIFHISVVKDPNVELLHFLSTTNLKEEYKKEYIHPDEASVRKDLDAVKSTQEPVSFIKDISTRNFALDILAFLKQHVSQGESFTVELIASDPTLDVTATKLILVKERKEELDIGKKEEQVYKDFLIKEALGILIAYNDVIAEEEKYYFLLDKIKIENYVMEIIQDVCNRRHELAGIRKEYIQIKLKEKFGFDKKVSPKITQRALIDLNDKGLIYPTGDREYRVTFE